MQNVFVTGATGFLGRHLCMRLKKLGFEVWGLGRNPTMGLELNKQGIHFVEASLSEIQSHEKVLKILGSSDLVIHSAALSSPWGNPKHFVEANVLGTQNLLQAMDKCHVKNLIHISTPSIYMADAHQLNVLEDIVLPKPINEYAKTKKMAEDLVLQWAKPSDRNVIVLRPQGIFGPHDQAIFPRLIKVAEKGFFPIIGDAETLMDLTYVDNVVDAIELSIRTLSQNNGKIFNISNGQPLELYPYLEKVFRGLGIKFKFKKIPRAIALSIAHVGEWKSRIENYQSEPLLTRYGVTLLSRSRTLNIDSAKKHLGYKAKISIDEGLDRTLVWLKGQRSK